MGLLTKYAIQAFNPVITPTSNSSAALLGSIRDLTKDAIKDPLDTRIKLLKMNAEVMRELNGIQDGIRANKRLAADIAYRQGLLKNARDKLAFEVKKYNDKLRMQGQSSALGKVLSDIATTKTDDSPDSIAKTTDSIIFKIIKQDMSNPNLKLKTNYSPLGDVEAIVPIDNKQEPMEVENKSDNTVQDIVKNIVNRKTGGLKDIKYNQTKGLSSILNRRGITRIPDNKDIKEDTTIENNNQEPTSGIDTPNVESQSINLMTDLAVAKDIVKPEKKLIDKNIALEKVKNMMKDDLNTYINEYKQLSGGRYPTTKELAAISKMVDNKWKNRLKYILSIYDQADSLKASEAKKSKDLQDLKTKLKLFKAKKDYEYRLKEDYERKKQQLKQLFKDDNKN